MALGKKHPNRLGIAGWLAGGRYGGERYLYTLHRLTGLGILLYFALHILVNLSRVFGRESWDSLMAIFESPAFKIGEFLVFAAFAYHAFNGIRLVLIELGLPFAVGRAEEPVYPYKSSLNVQRKLAVMVILAAALLVVVGGYDLFILGH
ncbi:MAG: succinate dehydrogenase, cytochrome b556 subunit [Candidatus Krumholzibacteriota bacterium]|nr:succinate dehydrogenase, cytochrome b556 subunit [Candidatus Krumholzibacteriota bacterium]